MCYYRKKNMAKIAKCRYSNACSFEMWKKCASIYNTTGIGCQLFHLRPNCHDYSHFMIVSTERASNKATEFSRICSNLLEFRWKYFEIIEQVSHLTYLVVAFVRMSIIWKEPTRKSVLSLCLPFMYALMRAHVRRVHMFCSHMLTCMLRTIDFNFTARIEA